MNKKNLLIYASITSVITTLCIVYVLLPSDRVDLTITISAILLSLSIGNLFYAPVLITHTENKQDASILSAVGILSVSSILILALTAIALYLALNYQEKLSFAIDILSVGGYILSMLITSWSTGLVNEISNTYTIQSNHKKWARKIKELSLLNEHVIHKGLLIKLYEKFEYSSSDTPNDSKYDQEIEIKIEALESEMIKAESKDIITIIEQLGWLISSRESSLRAIRNKA